MTTQHFDNIDSLYKHLEEEAVNYEHPHQIDGLFRNLRDLKQNQNENDEAEKAQWEVDIFNFVIDDGELKPKFIGTNEEGQQVEYPSLKGFTNEAYSYIKTRAESTSNDLLRARYYHILWLSPKRHHEYSKKAIDSYIELINIFEKKDQEAPKKHYGLRVLETMKNLLSLSFQVNYKVDEIKNELKRIIKFYSRESSSSFALRVNLIGRMLEQKKKFTNDDFEGVEEACWDIAHDLIKSGNVFGAIDMFQLGGKVDQKLEKKSHDWEVSIAESHEKLMEMAGSNLVASTHCMTAIECYKKLKNAMPHLKLDKC